MTMNQWKDDWVKSVIEAGFSQSTASDTYTALYGRDGPDLTKNPQSEAAALLGKLETR